VPSDCPYRPSNTIQQYLRESLIDELHIAIAPLLLGGGERLFDGTKG
jgi:dihydrofolate reductase